MEKWRLALEMIDELAGWGITPPVILADGAYGDNTQFRQELEQRRSPMCWMSRRRPRPIHRTSGLSAPPIRVGASRRSPLPREPSSLKNLALASGRTPRLEVLAGGHPRGDESRFLALRVRPANVQLRNGASRAGEEIPSCWLICEWPAHKDEPVKYWLSNLPAGTPIEDLVRLGKLRWRIEHDYRELKDALGLDHFEGRSYRGFNHHVTLVSVAHAFLTLERRRGERRPRLRAAA